MLRGLRCFDDSSHPDRQLTASDINFAIVRPLVMKYARLRNMAVIYACMVVRSYFLAQSSSDLAHSGVMLSRATLCEIMALKLLNHFASSKIQLAAVLTTLWNPLAGAPADVIEEVKDAIGGEDEYDDNPQCAIEVSSIFDPFLSFAVNDLDKMAIATKAKTFLASPLVQSVVNDMYNGRIIVSIVSNRSMVADNYKQRATAMYDPRTAPILDHYRSTRHFRFLLELTLCQIESSTIFCDPALRQHSPAFDDFRCLSMEYVSLVLARL